MHSMYTSFPICHLRCPPKAFLPFFFDVFSFWGLLFRFNCTHQEMPHLDSIQAQKQMAYFQIIFSNHIMSPPASQPAKPAKPAKPASQPATQPASQPHPPSQDPPDGQRPGGNVNLPNLVQNSLPNSRSEVPIRVAEFVAEFDAGFSKKCSSWGAGFYAEFFQLPEENLPNCVA